MADTRGEAACGGADADPCVEVVVQGRALGPYFGFGLAADLGPDPRLAVGGSPNQVAPIHQLLEASK